MKSATVIVIAEVLDYKLVSASREVEDPGGAFNSLRRIPLRLSRISANAVLTLRGNVRGPFHFYSWVWASGHHGGERLFRPYAGYWHVLFLRDEDGYLHTVGDYPSYDLEIPRDLLSATLAGFESVSESGSDVFERIASVCVRAELESANAIHRDFQPSAIADLAGLTSERYLAYLLDSFCRDLRNPFGRFAACMATAQEFSGRCEAYRLARQADSAGVEAPLVTQALARCEAQESGTIAWLQANNWPDPAVSDGWQPSSERHRLAMRLFASAMDPDFRTAACAAAATMPEAHDLPECGSSGKPKYD
jgi:hypothetical protein